MGDKRDAKSIANMCLDDFEKGWNGKCATLVKIKEVKGMPRTTVTEICGKTVRGISVPVGALSPTTAAELLQRDDVVFATPEDRKMLEKYLKGWL